MKDGSNASGNAAKEVYGEEFVASDEKCYVHASVRWFPNNKRLFRDPRSRKPGSHSKSSLTKKGSASSTMSRMFRDLSKYRACPFEHLCLCMLALMYNKWKNVYKERKVADAWMSAWAEAKICRVQRNHDNPLRGGLPSDNNVVERRNRDDKEFFDCHRKTTIDSFLHACLSRVRYLSLLDRSFVSPFKPAVTSMKFHQRVNLHWKAHQQTNSESRKKFGKFYPNSLHLQFRFLDSYNDAYPRGTRLMVTGTGINVAGKQMEKCGYSINKHSEWKRFFSKADDDEHEVINTAKMFLEDSTKTVYEHYKKFEGSETHPFDALVADMANFVVISPVDPTVGQMEEDAIRSLRDRLEISGYSVMSMDALIRRKLNGFCSCSCDLWLHYGWCNHAYLVCLERGIIDGFPPSRDPENCRPLDKQVGRPSYIARGMDACLRIDPDPKRPPSTAETQFNYLLCGEASDDSDDESLFDSFDLNKPFVPHFRHNGPEETYEDNDDNSDVVEGDLEPTKMVHDMKMDHDTHDGNNSSDDRKLPPVTVTQVSSQPDTTAFVDSSSESSDGSVVGIGSQEKDDTITSDVTRDRLVERRRISAVARRTRNQSIAKRTRSQRK